MYYIMFLSPNLEKMHIVRKWRILTMYQTLISFTPAYLPATLSANASSLYSEEAGFGFVTEVNRNEQELLQIPELNSAFAPWYWDNGRELTVLTDTPEGVAVAGSSCYPEGLPLSFKLKLPHQGNYRLTLTVTAGEAGCPDLTVFTGRRHLALRKVRLAPHAGYTAELTVSVCDIIPRGKEKPYEDRTLDITLLGSDISLSYIEVSEAEVPTVYIAGDSTVTDQSGSYPYDPGCCYCGWGQMLSAYLLPGISVSNHAHSGLTSETFRSEGHYEVLRRFIRPGDYFLMQFAHNDQKLPHLDAAGGYRSRLIAYVEEIRSLDAVPVIVTPLARNTWKGDGAYNDLLADYAAECIRIGQEYNVPVIDLHRFSMDFILREGLDSAKRYYYPKDYTHSNDYGAYLMAGYVASRLGQLTTLKPFLNPASLPVWIPPQSISLPLPPEGAETEAASVLPLEQELEHPDEPVTRVELLRDLVKTVGYVPMNVYNDMYPDVIGHEWYAGVVEVCFQNSLVDAEFTADGQFHPLEPVTFRQLISFCANGYKSRKASALKKDKLSIAKELSLIPDGWEPEKAVTRREALRALRKLERAL